MNTEDEEFERIEREIKMRALPDAIHHTDTSETLEYIQGWNDCRQAMLAEQPAQQEPVATLFGSLPVYDTTPQAQQEPVAGVVLRDGQPTLLQDKHIKETDERLFRTLPQAPKEQHMNTEDSEFQRIEREAAMRSRVD